MRYIASKVKSLLVKVGPSNITKLKCLLMNVVGHIDKSRPKMRFSTFDRLYYSLKVTNQLSKTMQPHRETGWVPWDNYITGRHLFKVGIVFLKCVKTMAST